jgi:signal transduction histidine kinase
MEYSLAQLGFTLTISSDGTAPIVRADREALTQAILNLLGNAMKYSGDARAIEMRTGTRNDEAFVDVVDHWHRHRTGGAGAYFRPLPSGPVGRERLASPEPDWD